VILTIVTNGTDQHIASNNATEENKSTRTPRAETVANVQSVPSVFGFLLALLPLDLLTREPVSADASAGSR
jgi:hypothetical protein